MAKKRKARSALAAFAIIVLLALGSLSLVLLSVLGGGLNDDERADDFREETPRFLSVNDDVADDSDNDNERNRPYLWAREHLLPVATGPHPARRDAAIFWYIPKSGGAAVKTIYECLGVTLAHKIDPRHGDRLLDGDDSVDRELQAFHPWPGVSRASYVNVDVTSGRGLERAKRMGLVPSGVADLIVATDVVRAVETLFDGTGSRGRLLALFRHPVDRLVSKFFYLRKATWDPQYRPQWNNINVLEFARVRNNDNNHVVKKLAGLGANDTATPRDLRVAMKTVRSRFVVGLLDRMEESVRRFNVVLGVDAEGEEEDRRCMDHLLRESVGARRYERARGNPKVEPGSATWNALAERNALDIQLYEFIVTVFDDQKEIIESYNKTRAMNHNRR